MSESRPRERFAVQARWDEATAVRYGWSREWRYCHTFYDAGEESLETNLDPADGVDEYNTAREAAETAEHYRECGGCMEYRPVRLTDSGARELAGADED